MLTQGKPKPLLQSEPSETFLTEVITNMEASYIYQQYFLLVHKMYSSIPRFSATTRNEVVSFP
jgi:hypothetical protein